MKCARWCTASTRATAATTATLQISIDKQIRHGCLESNSQVLLANVHLDAESISPEDWGGGGEELHVPDALWVDYSRAERDTALLMMPPKSSPLTHSHTCHEICDQ